MYSRVSARIRTSSSSLCWVSLPTLILYHLDDDTSKTEIAVQILIVFVGGSAFQVSKITGPYWVISLGLGLVVLPLGALIRCIPNEPIEKSLKYCGLLPYTDAEDELEQWNNPAINRVRANLATYAKIRGGRLRRSSFAGMSRSQQLEKAGIKL